MDPGFHERTIRAAVETGALDDERPMAAFVDTTGVRQTIQRLKQSFPKHFEHMFAAKANTMRRALQLVRAEGMGCEVASPGELEQAIRSGFGARDIVFDEPAKTPAVLKKVLASGIGLNIDSFQEFERVKRLRTEDVPPTDTGFRINPQVGAGTIGAMSTATPSSKFGVALDDRGNREALVDCYRTHDWLNSLHTHIGSQGCSLDLMVEGVKKVVDLADEINHQSACRRIEVIDIGGGLPVNFENDDVTPTFADYAQLLQGRAPSLFDGSYRVKTEFGRSVFAKNGIIVSRVEYTKASGGRHIAITHSGAQVATRTVFMPDHWKIRISAHGADGRTKSGPAVEQDIAGPLCFAGDLVGIGRSLPLIEPGDHVVLHDTGAYYFSNPFVYNALPAPAVYGVVMNPDGLASLDCWRQQQTLDDMLAVIG